MLTTLATVFSEIVTMFGEVVGALFETDGAMGALLPYFLIGICCSIVLLGAKVIRSFVWGN